MGCKFHTPLQMVRVRVVIFVLKLKEKIHIPRIFANSLLASLAGYEERFWSKMLFLFIKYLLSDPLYVHLNLSLQTLIEIRIFTFFAEKLKMECYDTNAWCIFFCQPKASLA